MESVLTAADLLIDVYLVVALLGLLCLAFLWLFLEEAKMRDFAGFSFVAATWPASLPIIALYNAFTASVRRRETATAQMRATFTSRRQAMPPSADPVPQAR